MADKKPVIFSLPAINVDGTAEWSSLRARNHTTRHLQREIEQLEAELADIEAEREKLRQRAKNLTSQANELKQKIGVMRAYIDARDNNKPTEFDYDAAFRAIEAGADPSVIREQFQQLFPETSNDAFRAAMYRRRKNRDE